MSKDENNRYGGKPPMIGGFGTAGHPVKHKRARGGKIGDDKEEKAEVYSGKDSKTEEEAERKRGGKVAPKLPALAVGGAVSRHARMDRRGRARGGSVGADTSPLTSASKLSAPEGRGDTDD